MEVMELIEYLQELVDTAPKVPISGKVMLDKKEINEILEDLVSYLPDALKKAQWVLNEKDRILDEANIRYETTKKETEELIRKQIDNHDIVKEAKMKSQEIIALAQREAKIIRLGSRDYADEMLCQLDSELEAKGKELILSMKKDMDEYLSSISDKMIDSTNDIRNNIKELRDMK
ncbi:MAG: ATPase [Clostridium sp.]|uniref:ATPase n=1 Tax=Clostridium sp. TaxID=1506 RepID=UPI002A8CD294|nr:ATPase [Clostridium sp.]MDY5098136.1 ATPase [Clostridium sp.]